MYIGGHVFLIIGTSGSGKTTLFNKVRKYYTEILIPVYDTTRDKRANEIEGVDYQFISEREFIKKNNGSEYLAVYQCHGFQYGILEEVKEKVSQGKNVILGVSRRLIGLIKEQFTNVSVIYINVEYDEVENRIRNRKREKDENEIAERLSNAKDKIEWALDTNNYDFFITNDNIESSASTLINYIGEICYGRGK